MQVTNSKIKIAVTGVGGGVGQSIIKSLYNTNYDVVALDSETLATGLFVASTAYKIPYANHPDYINRLLEICKKEDCKILFPGLDAELNLLSTNRHLFSEIGTTVIVSDPDVINISDNKMLTYTFLSEHAVHVPYTSELTKVPDDFSNFPVILKPKTGGARSKNVFLCKTKNDFKRITSADGFLAEEFVLQEYIEGDEYTCGSVNFNGECFGVIVMKRILRDGDTYKCFSVKDKRVEEEVRKLLVVLKPFGACNIQLRIKDGKPYIFEINARCSGTTAARSLCGFNEPLMIADYLFKSKAPFFEIKYKTILRYWKELEVDNDKIEELISHGTISKLSDNFL